jgi:hypothetical protein
MLAYFALALAARDLSHCVDDSESCAAWAAQGECEKNERYMLEQCRLSCFIECTPLRPPPLPPSPPPSLWEQHLYLMRLMYNWLGTFFKTYLGYAVAIIVILLSWFAVASVTMVRFARLRT